MRLAILSTSPRCYSTKRLRQAARERGHRPRVCDTLRFTIDLAHGSPRLFYRAKPLPPTDAILPRIGASLTHFGTAVVRQFETMGVYTPSPASAIADARDKLRALQILSRHDIGIPQTAFVRARDDLLPAIRRIGGAPVVIKVLEGTQGVGVILAETEQGAEAIVETLQFARQNVLVQRYVAESRGSDLRALVVGDRVVAAMRRTARVGEFRSNVHRGGSFEGVALPPAFERTAVHAARIMGLSIAGVDLLEGGEGPLVMEVNSSPGLEGIEEATSVDVAGAIIDHIAGRLDLATIRAGRRRTNTASDARLLGTLRLSSAEDPPACAPSPPCS